MVKLGLQKYLKNKTVLMELSSLSKKPSYIDILTILDKDQYNPYG